MKKRTRVLTFMAFVMFSLVLVSCTKGKINLDKTEVTLNAGETHQINATFKDEKEFTYESSKTEVATVSETGLVTALTKGNAVITIKTKDSKVKAELKVIVNQEIKSTDVTLALGMTKEMEFSDDVIFESDNEYIAKISEDSIITAVSKGKTFIKVKTKSGNLIEIINVTILDKLKEVEITGPKEFYLDDNVKFEWKLKPINGFNLFKFEYSDDSVLEINQDGTIKPITPGKTKVRIISLQSDDIYDEIEITLNKTVLVSKGIEKTDIGNWTFTKENDIFDNIEQAMNHIEDKSKIIVKDLTLNEELKISKSITIQGLNSKIINEVLLDADSITMEGFEFLMNANISNTDKMNNFIFRKNIISDIEGSFLEIRNYNNLAIYENKFIKVSQTSIFLDDISPSSTTMIENNVIDDTEKAIVINASERMKINYFIKIYRNKINDVETAFELNLNNQNKVTNAELYARFNEVTNYNKAVHSHDDNMFEFTLNYWGVENLELEKFVNVEEKNILGHYKNAFEILPVDKYNPKLPIIVDIVEVIDEIKLGEKFKLDVLVLPYTSDKNNVVLIVDNRRIVELTSSWELIPIRTGMVELTVSEMNSRENAKYYDIKVTTDPGMHFDIDNPTHDLNIGDVFTIKALPFPYDIANEKVSYQSSNSDIAKINDVGEVTITGVGEFIIMASINGDVVLSETLEFTSYDEFDDDDVFDFITRKQLTYSKMYEITLFGSTNADVKHNESVTRVLLKNYDIYREHEWFLDKVYPDFRPGTPFNSELPEEYKFNDDNVVWIVVHDTGSTGVGSGARSHAKYLYDQATNNGRKASWHYTVDSKEAFLHLPENEIAFHAGDGSSIPGIDKISPSLGGGNRNGIGIEMSVQRDGHVFKTWQNTANLVGGLLDKYNLPLSHQRYHNDFSGKECPQTLRKAGLLGYFEELVENEYNMSKNHGNKIKHIEFESHNPDILNNEGTIIKTPDLTTKVSYTITLKTTNDEIYKRTFNTLVEGYWR